MLTIRLEREIVDALYDIKVRDGIPVNEQVKRAIQMWLEEKREVAPPPARPPKRGPTR